MSGDRSARVARIASEGRGGAGEDNGPLSGYGRGSGGRTAPALVAESVWRRRMSVSREELIELIEGEDAKLSPAGRELWEKLELMVQSAPEEATAATLPPPTPEELLISAQTSKPRIPAA